MPDISRCMDITREQPILINLTCYLPVQKGPEIRTSKPWIVVLKRKISSRAYATFYLFNNCNKFLVGRLWADNSHRSDASEQLGRVNAGLLRLLQVQLLLLQLVLWADTLGWLGALDTKKSIMIWKIWQTCNSLPESIQLLLDSHPVNTRSKRKKQNNQII